MANQSAPEEDCRCADLIMFALLFPCVCVWQSGLKSVSQATVRRTPSSLVLNCCVKKIWTIAFFCVCVVFFYSWPFIILHVFKFSFLHFTYFFCCISAFWTISPMFAVLYRFWSKQSSEWSRFWLWKLVFMLLAFAYQLSLSFFLFF